MSSWEAQLEDAKKEIAELERRISALREELQTVQTTTAAATVQRILAIREQQLERTKRYAQFIEDEIAQGSREAKPIPCAGPASMSRSGGAQRTGQGETAETLKTVGKTFCAEAHLDLAKGAEPTPAGPRSAGPGRHSPPR